MPGLRVNSAEIIDAAAGPGLKEVLSGLWVF